MTVPLPSTAQQASPHLVSAGGLVAVALACAVLAAFALWRLRARGRGSDPQLADRSGGTVETSIDLPAGPVPPVELHVVAAQSTRWHEATVGGGGTPAHRGTPTQGVGYAELSRSCAELGRAEDAVLAQWAADLRLVRPLLTSRAEELPERVLHIDALSPRHAMRSARGEVLSLIAARDLGEQVPPLFRSADHIPELPGPGSTAVTALATPDELRGRALSLMGLAASLVTSEPASARLCARLSDLAALDAVLLDSAELFGDDALVSVELRQQLAAAALHDQCRARDVQPLISEVRETREVLRRVVEPHELARLEEAWAEEPVT